MRSHARRKGIGFIILAIAFAGAVHGCGSESSGPSAPNDHQPPVLSGVFVDAVVEGLAYRAGTTDGVTDAKGKFGYTEGDSISFYVGSIALGHAQATQIVTPVTLVPGSEDEQDPTVTNITRFLLTLDDDAEPSNSIQISSAVRNAAVGMSVDFAQSTQAFGDDPVTTTVIDSLTSLTQSGRRQLTGIWRRAPGAGRWERGQATGCHESGHPPAGTRASGRRVSRGDDGRFRDI